MPGTMTATAGKCALVERYALPMRIAIPADLPMRTGPLGVRLRAYGVGSRHYTLA